MKKLAMIIMDGIGLREDAFGNAIAEAYTPNLDRLLAEGEWAKIKAHGTAVGLPGDDDMGNSEVGHNALGCGQIYAQGAKLVNESISSGLMFESPTWRDLIDNAKTNSGAVHFIGLLSDGNVHSNIGHLMAMVERAKNDGVTRIFAHVLLDGRDVAAQSGLEYIDKLEDLFNRINDDKFHAAIASGGGRQVITMDRYGANWPMVKAGWDVHVHGIGAQFASASEAILAARASSPDIIDQDLPAFVIAKNGAAIGKMRDGDSVVLFNFRGDRAIEISRAFDDVDFAEFDRGNAPKVRYAGMLQYDGDLKIPQNFLVAPPDIRNTLTELLVKNKIKQYAVSETQKYGHVTYFWNGNRNEKFSEELEDYCEILSDVLPFEQRPWMQAAQITDAVISAMAGGEYGFIRANFPNGDMVGHTGDIHAAQIAVSAVDLCLGRILAAAKEFGVTLIITADHGNADEMLEKTKTGISPKTAHTLNPVPFIIVNEKNEYKLLPGEYGLANAAATVAKILGIEPPAAWERSMI